MKKSFLSLDCVNKFQAATPLFLFVGCDGSRGDELGITLVATLFLAFLLSFIEPYYRKAATTWIAVKSALLCAIVTILVSFVELNLIWKIGKLHGPVGYYGIAPIVCGLSGSLFIFAFLCVWADRDKRLEK